MITQTISQYHKQFSQKRPSKFELRWGTDSIAYVAIAMSFTLELHAIHPLCEYEIHDF